MTTKKDVYLAIDTAYQRGVVILFSREEILFTLLLQEKMAHGREICSAIDKAVLYSEEHSLTLGGVFTGLGPGSFIGTRIAMATTLGFSYARSLPLMGFCSHRALAFSLPEEQHHFYIFMKASGDVGYVAEFGLKNGNFDEIAPPQVMARDDFLVKVYDKAFIVTDESEKLQTCQKKLTIYPLLGPTALGVMQAARAKVIQGILDESDFIRPNYVKPPTISEPKKSFIIG